MASAPMQAKDPLHTSAFHPISLTMLSLCSNPEQHRSWNISKTHLCTHKQSLRSKPEFLPNTCTAPNTRWQGLCKTVIPMFTQQHQGSQTHSVTHSWKDQQKTQHCHSQVILPTLSAVRPRVWAAMPRSHPQTVHPYILLTEARASDLS